MTGGSDKYIKQFLNFTKIPARIAIILFAVLFIASCPEPMTDNLLAEVEDVVGPEIAFTYVNTLDYDPADTYEMIAYISVEGTIKDYSDKARTIEGSVISASFSDNYGGALGIKDDIVIDSDGGFLIGFSTLNLSVSGAFVLVITSTDWNNNSSQFELTFIVNDSAPKVIFDCFNEPSDYIYSSNLDESFIITGQVGITTTNFTYRLEDSSGSIQSSQAIDYTSSGDNSFSFSFNIHDIPASGEISVIYTITGNSKTESYSVGLIDDPDSPVMSGEVLSGNLQIDIDFNKPIYHSDLTSPLLTDFSVTNTASTGTGTITENEITIVSFSAPVDAGATSVSLDINFSGTMDGTEEITIASTIRDFIGNSSVAGIGLFPFDESQPLILSISANDDGDVPDDDDTYYKENDVIYITIEFSEDIVVTGTPVLDLNTTGSVVYDSVSGSSLYFIYTVGSDDDAAPLSCVSLSGSIADSVPNDAILTLPGTSSGNSLYEIGLTVDTVIPFTPIVNGSSPTNLDPTPTSGNPIWSWISGGGDGSGNYQYRLNSGSWNTTTGLYLIDTTGLTTGDHTLEVQERDAAGNWSLSGSSTITVDITAPGPPDVSGSSPTNLDPVPDAGDPIWSWTSGIGDGSGNYQYRLDGGAWSTETTNEYYIDTIGLTTGDHTLYVQERDAIGNWSSSGSKIITVDITAPGPPDVSGSSPTNLDPVPDSGDPIWSWTSGSGDGSGNYQYRLDSGVWSDETINTYYIDTTGLITGDHTLEVQERDTIGNWSVSGTRSITVDTSAPELVSVILVDNGSPGADDGDTITFNFNDEIALSSLVADDTPDDPNTLISNIGIIATESEFAGNEATTSTLVISGNTITITLQGVAADEHGFYMPDGIFTPDSDLEDLAGNPIIIAVNPNEVVVSGSWDETPPTITIVSALPAALATGNITVIVTYLEPIATFSEAANITVSNTSNADITNTPDDGSWNGDKTEYTKIYTIGTPATGTSATLSGTFTVSVNGATDIYGNVQTAPGSNSPVDIFVP